MTLPRKIRPQHLPRACNEEWSWQLEGNCRGYPSDIFYPEDNAGTNCVGAKNAQKVFAAAALSSWSVVITLSARRRHTESGGP